MRSLGGPLTGCVSEKSNGGQLLLGLWKFSQSMAAEGREITISEATDLPIFDHFAIALGRWVLEFFRSTGPAGLFSREGLATRKHTT